jgi:hypothetical protein
MPSTRGRARPKDAAENTTPPTTVLTVDADGSIRVREVGAMPAHCHHRSDVLEARSHASVHEVCATDDVPLHAFAFGSPWDRYVLPSDVVFVRIDGTHARADDLLRPTHRTSSGLATAIHVRPHEREDDASSTSHEEVCLMEDDGDDEEGEEGEEGDEGDDVDGYDVLV